MQFICYSKCGTCQKAAKWLKENNIEVTERSIKDEKPTAGELRLWYEKSGLPIKKLFNTSGLLYKELGLKDRLPSMTEDEQLALLASDGMLVKRPVLVSDDFVLFGFKEAEWKAKLE